MKYIRNFTNDSEYQSYRNGKGWSYTNPNVCQISDESKVIFKKNISHSSISLIPTIEYEDEYIISYKFETKESDLALIEELYHVYMPLFKLNDEEKEIANEVDGHLAKNIIRDTTVFPFYINDILVQSVNRYFQYDNYDYETPTYSNDYYEINDIDDNIVKKLSLEVGQDYNNISEIMMRFKKDSIYASVVYNKINY